MEMSTVENMAENIIAGNSMILKKSMIRRIKSLTNDFNSWWDQRDEKLYSSWYLGPPPSSYFTNFNFNNERKD